MRARVVLAFSIAVLLAVGRAVFAQRSASLPDLQGTWNGSTLTPLERPVMSQLRIDSIASLPRP
jgi:hypothetical protein